MTAQLFSVSSVNAFSSTLNGSIAAGDASITLTSVTGLVAPGVLCVDRLDSAGVSTPTIREYISFTGISINTLTGVSRGLAGSTAQSHSSGAIIEENFSVSHWTDLLDYLAVSHDTGGNILVTSTATISDIHATTFKVAQHLYASGASITGNFPLNPVWTFTAGASTVSTMVSQILSMPQPGSLSWFSITLNGPASGASYIFDINKNGTSIFAAGTRPTVAGGGTFVSTASIATKLFNSGDKFWIDIDGMGDTQVGVTVQGRG